MDVEWYICMVLGEMIKGDSNAMLVGSTDGTFDGFEGGISGGFSEARMDGMTDGIKLGRAGG